MERDDTHDQWLEAIASHAASPTKTPGGARRDAILVRVVDTLGCALGARHSDAAQVSTAYAARRSAGGSHAVWGTDVTTDLEGAALANGVASRYLDYNDAYFGVEPIHPSDVIPTMLALALERQRSDDDFLDAVAVAYEVAMAAADRIAPRLRGFDHVNVTMLGATAGAARLLELPEEQARHAVAIAVTSHGGAFRQARTGQLSMWKGFAAADACRHGAYAALLASLGARGPAAPFVGQNAMFRRALQLTPDDVPPFPAAADEPNRIAGSQIKRFPCGSVGQSAGQAATDLVRRGIRLDEVDHLELRLDPKSAALMVSPEKMEPATRETADHSIPYVIVSTLRFGELSVETFTDERVFDDAVRAFLRDHVSVGEDPELGGGHDMGFPVALELSMKDGRTETHMVEHPPGSPGNPMPTDELREKFTGSVGRSPLADRLDDIWDTAWSLGGGNHTVAELDRLLRL